MHDIYEQITEEMYRYYNTTWREARTDAELIKPYGKRLQRLLQTVDDEQYDIVCEIVRQISIDTIASLFCVIEGNYGTVTKDVELELLADGEPITEDLTSEFLNMVEEIDEEREKVGIDEWEKGRQEAWDKLMRSYEANEQDE